LRNCSVHRVTFDLLIYCHTFVGLVVGAVLRSVRLNVLATHTPTALLHRLICPGCWLHAHSARYGRWMRFVLGTVVLQAAPTSSVALTWSHTQLVLLHLDPVRVHWSRRNTAVPPPLAALLVVFPTCGGSTYPLPWFHWRDPGGLPSAWNTCRLVAAGCLAVWFTDEPQVALLLPLSSHLGSLRLDVGRTRCRSTHERLRGAGNRAVWACALPRVAHTRTVGWLTALHRKMPVSNWILFSGTAGPC